MRLAIPLLALFLTAAALPAAAAEDEDRLPQFPKAGPPNPLPEAACDTRRADAGDWLLGRWVGPQTALAFTRGGESITWVMDRKSNAGEFGWTAGAVFDGRVAAVTGCTVRLTAGPDDAFVFEGVLTGEGRLYGYAVNKAGADVRFVLRREK